MAKKAKRYDGPGIQFVCPLCGGHEFGKVKVDSGTLMRQCYGAGCGFWWHPCDDDRYFVKVPKRGVCQVCGCTETRPCRGGCSWADTTETLCSKCAPFWKRTATAADKEPFTIFNLLHRLWTKAVDTKDYNKREWQELERFVLRAGGMRENIESDRVRQFAEGIDRLLSVK